MAKTLNVLSIDFSYFQNITGDTLSNYPEGKDVSSDMTEMIWSSYYIKNENKIRAVTVNENEYKKATEYLKLCPKNIPVMIAENHKPIYEFICNEMHDTSSIRLNLIHIDMYHDMFNDNYVLDNGNWIKFISDDFDTYTEWITNPVSKSLYGLDKPQFKKILTQIPDSPTEDFPDASSINAVFLCKNTSLLPPHLDPYFTKLVDSVKANHPNTKILNHACDIRDIDELIKRKRILIANNS